MDANNAMWFTWWQDSDFIVRAVFVLLCFLSLTSWSLIVHKWRQLRHILKLELATASRLTQAITFGELQQATTTNQPSYALLMEAQAVTKTVLPLALEMATAQLNQCVRENHLRLESGLTLLATIGNAAPFIGLFGTVWGIMHALNALGGDGAVVALDTIAGPVSEALVATAAGIFTAIPAVMGYNLMVRKLRLLGGVIEGNSIRIFNLASQQTSLLHYFKQATQKD
jgi:biopolymer transport protein ExbB